MSLTQSSLPLEPGVALVSWISEPNKHKIGHSWPQPLLLHGPLFVSQADTRSPAPSPAACCSLRLFTCIHLPVSSWFLDTRAAGPGCRVAGTRLSLFLVGPGSSYIWFLLLQDSFPSPCAHSSVSAPGSSHYTETSCICGISPIINKTYIYTVCRA